jgi:hypothetical protein
VGGLGKSWGGVLLGDERDGGWAIERSGLKGVRIDERYGVLGKMTGIVGHEVGQAMALHEGYVSSVTL